MVTQEILRHLDVLTDEAQRMALDVIAALAANPENRLVGERRIKSRPSLHIVARTEKPTGLLLEHPDAPCFIATPGGVVSWVSHALAQWLGVAPEHLLEDRWLALIDGDDERKRVAERWMVAAQRQTGLSYSARVRLVDGTIAYCFVRVSRVFSPSAPAARWMLGTVHPQILPVSLRPAAAQHS